MNLLPKAHEEFSHTEYWNTFYKERGKRAFEWYGEYPELCDMLWKYMKREDKILIVGCGNSRLGMSLYDVGYKNIINIDISHIVIKQMRDMNNGVRPDLTYEQMDVTQMEFSAESFGVVLDKGTLDALMPDTKETTVTTIDKYFKEITRILRNGGRYICISLLQEHILRKLLSYFPSSGFLFRILRCHEAEYKTRMEEGSSIPVFVIIATKLIRSSQTILEIALSHSPPERVSSTDDIITAVSSTQQAALICNSLQKQNIADGEEVSFDLYKFGNKHPRYTIYILDQLRAHDAKTYACFIVPQGKETDWLFSTKEGRQQVLKTAQRDRLVIVILHREHKFENLDTVKTELTDCVHDLAPANLCTKTDIPFLSLGSDVGIRNICYEGKSDMSGSFVIEEVEKDDHYFRRLVFLDNPYVIQSEARLKQVKSRRGKTKTFVDPGFLACKHHIYMSAGVNMTRDDKDQDDIMLVGLGGGSLCTFLRHCFPKLKITAVEIDSVMLKIATEYFDLTLDDNMKVEIIDGIQFIKDVAICGRKYKAILFDIDSKDTSIGMSCPPKQFLDISILKAVATCLTENGVFIMNLVSRDQTLKQKAKDDLNSVFESIASYAIQDEVNEIVISCMKKNNSKEWEDKFRVAMIDLNEQATTRKLFSFKDAFDISTILETLSLKS